MLTPVILSGGAGTRLWPLSRELYPKQLLPLTGARTMLQQTVLRLEGLTSAAPVIVCNEAHRFLVAEQLRQVRAAQQHFLGLWAIEEALILPGLDRVAADINGVGRAGASRNASGADDRRSPLEGM